MSKLPPHAHCELAYVSHRCGMTGPFLVVDESLDEIPPDQVVAMVRENPDGPRRLTQAVFKAMGWTGE